MNKRIFLADDDMDDCDMFKDALSDVGLETMLNTSYNGQELMKALEEKVPPAPDVIFLDLNMPIKSGFECLTEIRSTEKLKNIPVVVISTSSEEGFIDRVYKDGADYYICKPHSFKQLKSAISHALSIDWNKSSGQLPRSEFVLKF